MIFQDPMTSLNPVHTVGAQLIEAALLHRDISKSDARKLAIDGLDEVGIPRAEATDRRLPSPVLGRDASARDDRDGSHQRARPPDRGRADDGARRDDAGPDPQPDPAAAGGAWNGSADDHARPRSGRRGRGRGRGHVRRERRRASERLRPLRAPSAPVYLGSPRVAPSAGCHRRPVDADPGTTALAVEPAKGCRFAPRCSHAFARCREETPQLVSAGQEQAHLDACFLDDERKVDEAGDSSRRSGRAEPAA